MPFRSFESIIAGLFTPGSPAFPKLDLFYEDIPVNYSDKEVVAAFNSCLDLAKYNSLPTAIQNRFKELHNHHRVKMVCFFAVAGFGLRVYNDSGNYVFEDDMVQESNPPGVASPNQVDVDGHWMRCPAEAFQPKQIWLVMSGDGRRFWDGEESDPWSSRGRAVKFTDKLVAQAKAQEVDGVVVKGGD